MLTPSQIAAAWHSVTDEWIVRRNKAHEDGRQWEVVHHWGGETIAPETMKVLARYAHADQAHVHADVSENGARGAAVLKLIEETK